MDYAIRIVAGLLVLMVLLYVLIRVLGLAA